MAPGKSGGKNSSNARQAVKNAKRKKRDKLRPWMSGKPMMRYGSGGTDKSGTRGSKGVYYSDAPASK